MNNMTIYNIVIIMFILPYMLVMILFILMVLFLIKYYIFEMIIQIYHNKHLDIFNYMSRKNIKKLDPYNEEIWYEGNENKINLLIVLLMNSNNKYYEYNKNKNKYIR